MWLKRNKALPKPEFSSRLIGFSPGLIECSVAPPSRIRNRKLWNRGFIKCGDWDLKHVRHIEESVPWIVETVKKLFEQGCSYTETEQYHRMISVIDQYRRKPWLKPGRLGAYWCRTRQDVDRYFEILLDSYRDMQQHGYRTQQELMQINPSVVRSQTDEIRLHVCREGTLVLGRGGTHRLLMAKQLQLSVVPGVIDGVHEHWAERMIQANRAAGRTRIDRLLAAIQDTWPLWQQTCSD